MEWKGRVLFEGGSALRPAPRPGEPQRPAFTARVLTSGLPLAPLASMALICREDDIIAAHRALAGTSKGAALLRYAFIWDSRLGLGLKAGTVNGD